MRKCRKYSTNQNFNKKEKKLDEKGEEHSKLFIKLFSQPLGLSTIHENPETKFWIAISR